ASPERPLCIAQSLPTAPRQGLSDLVLLELIQHECFGFFGGLCGRFQHCNKRTLLLTIEPVPICSQSTDNTCDCHLSTTECAVVKVKQRHTSLAQQLINWASHDVIVAHCLDIASCLSNKCLIFRVLKLLSWQVWFPIFIFCWPLHTKRS